MKLLRGLGVLLCTLAALRGQPQLLCTTTGDAPPTLRAEGINDPLADIILRCTGGTPTPTGQPVPTTNITVTLNTALTSRILSNGSSEALLLIDEPGSPTNPTAPFVPCLTPFLG